MRAPPRAIPIAEHIRPPDIHPDNPGTAGLYWEIVRISAMTEVRRCLEIGSGGGQGSTKAFFEGAWMNPEPVKLHLVEGVVSQVVELKRQYGGFSWITIHHVCTVPRAEAYSDQYIERFFKESPITGEIPSWHQRERDRYYAYFAQQGLEQQGLARILDEHGPFNFVLVDGGSYTGLAEAKLVLETEPLFLALDDIYSLKNRDSHRLMLKQEDYERVALGPKTPNHSGWAIFRRKP